MQFHICNFIIFDQRIKNDIKIIDKNLKFIKSFTLLFIFLEALLLDLSNQYHNDILNPFRHRKIPGQFIFCSQITLPISRS